MPPRSQSGALGAAPAKASRDRKPLARRLREEATSYREVLDDVRRQAAQRALTDGELSIADIAERLGFASTQSFNRAFRRWTGRSPASYRARQR